MLLDRVYDAAGYGKYIYGDMPQPPLPPDDAALLNRFVEANDRDAFEMLVQVSADSHERVRCVAATIVRQSTGAHDNS